MYSRLQEDKTEEHFIKVGFELVEDTSRRTTHEGDRIMRHIETGQMVMIDHKSTKNDVGIRITVDQLVKIAHEADLCSKRKGEEVIPVLTFSYKGMKKRYAIFRIEDLDKLIGGKDDNTKT